MVSGAGSIIYGHTHTTLLQDTIIIAQYYITYLPVVLELHLIIYHLYNKKKDYFLTWLTENTEFCHYGGKGITDEEKTM